jgi:hypothetical protein
MIIVSLSGQQLRVSVSYKQVASESIGYLKEKKLTCAARSFRVVLYPMIRLIYALCRTLLLLLLLSLSALPWSHVDG